jgi:hypothetical protein
VGMNNDLSEQALEDAFIDIMRFETIAKPHYIIVRNQVVLRFLRRMQEERWKRRRYLCRRARRPNQ